MKPVNYDALTQPQRRQVRERYIDEQGGLCAHCKGSLLDEPPEAIRDKRVNWKLFPPNFTRYPVHLHHNHETGMTIGAVHALCNAVLWQFHGE